MYPEGSSLASTNSIISKLTFSKNLRNNSELLSIKASKLRRRELGLSLSLFIYSENNGSSAGQSLQRTQEENVVSSTFFVSYSRKF